MPIRGYKDNIEDWIIGFEWDTSNVSPDLIQIDVDGNPKPCNEEWFNNHYPWKSMWRCTQKPGETPEYGSNARGDTLDLTGADNKDVIVRVLGSIAIELCLVAEGVMDAVIDVRNKINGYDIAGAYLILEEAKGRITDLSGKKLEKEIEKTEKISLISTLDDEIYEKIREIFSVALIE